MRKYLQAAPGLWIVTALIAGTVLGFFGGREITRLTMETTATYSWSNSPNGKLTANTYWTNDMIRESPDHVVSIGPFPGSKVGKVVVIDVSGYSIEDGYQDNGLVTVVKGFFLQ